MVDIQVELFNDLRNGMSLSFGVLNDFTDLVPVELISHGAVD